MASISYLSWIAMGVLTWACFGRLWRTYRKKNVRSVLYLAKAFAHFGTFFLIMGLPGILPLSLSGTQLGAFYIFGHVFLYISLAYTSRIAFYIWKPEWELYAFAVNLLAGAAITLVNILTWNTPEIVNGIVRLNVNDPVGPLIGIIVLLNWIGLGTLFYGYLAMQQHGIERTKLLLLAAGFLLLTVAGPLHDNTTSINMLIAADVFTFLGVLLLMGGVYFKKLFSPTTGQAESRKL